MSGHVSTSVHLHDRSTLSMPRGRITTSGHGSMVLVRPAGHSIVLTFRVHCIRMKCNDHVYCLLIWFVILKYSITDFH